MTSTFNKCVKIFILTQTYIKYLYTFFSQFHVPPKANFIYHSTFGPFDLSLCQQRLALYRPNV